jgi:serine phosphatase RsbU (regulator of sigma subunit)
VGTTATAVVARLEQDDERGATRLRWSNAGHPPPMVVDAQGGVLALTGASSDLLLGVLPHTRRREAVLTLEHGTVVLLYTDGLVERRGQSLEVGLDRLQSALEDIVRSAPGPGLDLEELCDELLRRLLPPVPEDDVALVAVRLRAPRPPA